MNFSASGLAAGFIFGVIGMFVLRHGRKEANFPVFFIGVALIIYPYFVENDYLLWGAGVGLSWLAYKLR